MQLPGAAEAIMSRWGERRACRGLMFSSVTDAESCSFFCAKPHKVTMKQNAGSFAVSWKPFKLHMQHRTKLKSHEK